MRSFMLDNIEIITVHYNTPDLLDKLYESIRKYIGNDILFRVIDGSEMVYDKFVKLEKTDPYFKFQRQGFNIHHGNGMNKAIETSTKEYILILDSDCIVLKEGLIEKMLSLINENTYGVGHIVKTDDHGFDTNSITDFILYLHPKTMLLRRSEYFKYKPFKNHGAPCIYSMLDINNKSAFNILEHMPDLDEYVYEKGRGTVARFGYGLRTLRSAKKHESTKTLFNILVRTSRRPKYFKDCINSIRLQTYSNYKIIVSYDDDETYKYVKEYRNITSVKVERKDIPTDRPTFVDERLGKKRLYAPYNLYFNEMVKLCDPGAYIIILDDDDIFTTSDALYRLYFTIRTSDDIIFWRVAFPNRVVPSDKNFGERPICCDIASCGFTFNVKHWIDWDSWTMGDFRTSSMLFNKIKNRYFINKVLTGLQRQTANGLGRRDDK